MTPRDRRALVLGGVAVAGALLGLRLLPWTVRGIGDLHRRAAESVQTLARARAVLDASPARRDSLARALIGIVALAPKLVDGSSSAEAGASLSGLVSLAASRHALRVLRLDPLPDSAAAVFGRVAVRTELEGDLAGLTQFLHALEAGEPVLSATRLAVLAPDPAATGRPEVLRIEARVEGWYLRRGTP